MPYDQIAPAVLADARAFYKGDVKSSNKAYFARGDGGWQLDNSTDQKSRRNENRGISAAGFADRRADLKGKTPVDQGKILAAVDAGSRAGNCGEMSRVALHIAIEAYHVPPDKCFIGYRGYTSRGGILGFFKEDSKFGHEYLVLGTADEVRWVVDPWANTACAYTDYLAALRDKLRDWNANGKRILVTHKGRGAWVEPENELVTSIANEQEKLIPAQ